MEKFIKYLSKSHYKYDILYTDKKPVGVLVYTDYGGLYPPKEIYTLHDKIRKARKRCSRTEAEQRGHYTSLAVLFN